MSSSRAMPQRGTLSRTMRLGAGLVFCVAAIGLTDCASTRRAPSAESLTRQEWTQTLADVRAATEGGKHGEADRLLATFAARHPGTPEATETLYWRALYRLDAANKTHTATDALQMLDAYLAARPADSVNFPFRAEALVLRRVAAQTEQLGRALAAANRENAAARAGPPAPTRDPTVSDVAAKDSVIARLKDERDRAVDELERIKTRLQNRRP
jgi:hypothetical protein